MAKTRSKYVCQNCGRQSPRYMGRCPNCGEFNTMQEVVEEASRAAAPKQNRQPPGTLRAEPQRLREVSMEVSERLFIPVEEFNRVMGGGIVPGSIVLIGGEPGVGKCVTGDTRILDPTTGAYLPITAWKSTQRPVLSLDTDTLCLQDGTVSDFLPQGKRPIVEMTTRLGRSLRCTPDHPVYTAEGWRPVGDLQPGERLASPRILPYFGQHPIPDPEVKLIAYMLSDGSAGAQFTITNMQPEVLPDVEEIAAHFDMMVRVYTKKGSPARQYRLVRDRDDVRDARLKVAAGLKQAQAAAAISRAEWARRANVSYHMLRVWQNGETVPSAEQLQQLADAISIPLAELAPEQRDFAEMSSPLAKYLGAIGMRYVNAADKHVPDIIFELPRAQLATFLRVVFSCDGSVYLLDERQPGISYSTISKRLAQDLQHLLLRFGFVAKLRTKSQRVNGKPYAAYELQLLGIANVRRFLDEIGIMGREDAVAKVQSMKMPDLPSTHNDTVPTGPAFWEYVYETCGHNFAEISRRIGRKLMNRRHDRPLTRYTIQRLADAYDSPYFSALGYGDVYWDEVVSVVDAGEEDVYDIHVPKYHNFVANDMIIHNSTILLQVSAMLAASAGPVLYVSGEESARQIKMRADRLGLQAEDLYLLTETNLGNIFEQVNRLNPTILVVDSIQTVYSDDLDSSPGLVSQVRECASRLQSLAKTTGVSVFLVGHVTKEGSIAGPRVLEHIVDTVLYLEGDPFQAFRLLRSVKNRFGATSEVGVFEMQGAGMVEVPNPSEAFLAERVINAPGSAIAVTLEGTRPLLVEMQALTSPTSFGNPRRTPNGVDINRLLLISAVMSKRAGLRLHEQDIFINVIGGLKVTEPASDLAMAMAMASSYFERVIPADLAIMGEVGLSGEIRAVSQLAMRLNEAAKIGFKRVLVPKTRRATAEAPAGLTLIPARHIGEALDIAVPK